MTWIRIALFRDRAAAEAVRERLIEAGVRAAIHPEPVLATLWFVSRWKNGIRLEVLVNQADRAECLLREWDQHTGLLNTAIRCPGCGSLHIDFPQFTEKSILTNVAMGLASELGLVEKDFYCEDCHYAWTKPSRKPQHPRAHMAPNYFLDDNE